MLLPLLRHLGRLHRNSGAIAALLCRLRYFGDEGRWGFAFYTYSNEKYEMSVFPSGDFQGTPEEAFDTAARAYLT